jgi:hypothetical protein
MRIPELWRQSGRAGALPGTTPDPDPHPTARDRLAGLAARARWRTGALMGSLYARAAVHDEDAVEPTTGRVLAVAGTASAAWLTLCGLAWLAIRRWH